MTRYVYLFVVSALLVAVSGCGTSPSNQITLTSASFDFGVTPVGSAATKTAAVLENTGAKSITLHPALSGSSSFSLVTNSGCGMMMVLAPKQSCSVVMQFAPAQGANPTQQSATLNLGLDRLAPGTGETVAVTGTPGVPGLSLSATSYNFGDVLVGGSTTQAVSTLTNTGNLPLTLSPTLSVSPGFSLISSGGCGAQLAAGSSCSLMVQYAPTTASNPAQQTATLSAGAQYLSQSLPATVALAGTSGAISGTVSTTANSMVALYTLTLPFPGQWNVAFGPTTSYGRLTTTVTAATAGAATSVFVAGMLPNSTYHMQATATLTDGTTATDVDHTFATGALPAGIPASLPVSPGTGTPQPGIELVNSYSGNIPSTVFATDLQGNTIWAYPFADRTPNTYLFPAKFLTNGNLLVFLTPPTYPLGQAGSHDIREIDLAGDTVRDLSMATLNTELTAAGFTLPPLVNFSHDFLQLPNGHLLVITNTSVPYTNLTGFPGVTNVVGDVVVDLDTNWKPVWAWSEFDHLDVNRHPWVSQFPDWTHSNSLAYSATDGNFIISMRHQNWVMKVDYDNGAGSGNVMWTLGEGGNFKLEGGVDPTDWFYAQHDVTFPSTDTATTGVYSLTVMDNGDDRIFPDGNLCGSPGELACYTTIQELQINEAANTATFQFHQTLPSSIYSNFGGNVEVLANGNIEYMLAGPSGGSQIFEVTPGTAPDTPPTTVWQMSMPGSYGYRAFRQPSLYPGVAWQ